jgi:hypothetical protein
MDVSECLRQLDDRYRRCSTYQDAGRVVTVYTGDEIELTRVKRFTTAFVRPDRFRFELEIREGPGPHMRYIVWTAPDGAHLWVEPGPRHELEASLQVSVAAATGVSSGAAHTVPALLLPEVVGGWRLPQLRDPHLDDSAATVPGCRCIVGEGWHGLIRAWIDAEDFLLRRLETTHRARSGSAVTVTDYEPVLDQPVAPERLEPGIAQG